MVQAPKTVRPRRPAAVFLFLSLLTPSAVWAGKAIPAPPYSYVYNEGVVSSDAESRLSLGLRTFEERTGHQFALALFQNLDGEDVDDYSNKVFRAWKIGGKKGNDGLLFTLFKNDRRWRVEVGYGFEGALTDLEASEIARLGIPDFKNGDFDAGVAAVVQALEDKIEGKAVPGALSASGDQENNGSMMLLFSVLIVIWFLLRLRWVFSPYRMRGGWYGGGWGGGFGGGGFGGGGGFIGGGGSSGGGGASGGW